jgi:small conductance mechanosensitive channel
MIITPDTPDVTPVFQPIVSFDAIRAEVERFINQITTMSGEDIAERAAWTAGIIVAAFIFLWLLRIVLRLLARWLSPRQDKNSEEAKEARRTVGGWTMAAARFVVVILAIGSVLYVWGFDLRAGALGEALGVIWRAGLIFMIAIAAVDVFGFVINRVLDSGAKRSRNIRRASQLRTLSPVLNGATTTLVVLIAFMMTLSEFGVDIGPLIAGAGVIGLAIGFGAQTLVKDFLTGMFLILEDSVSIGDVVTIADFGGVVEDMSLRTIKLRDFDGTVHVFPYSEAQVIHNRTKGFSYAVFDIAISYNSDMQRALDIMRATGEEMREDEAFNTFITQPIEIAGVDRLDNSGILLKARIRTAPGKQWAVKRAYLQRIKIAFDGAGIDIPFPHLKLVSPDDPIQLNDPVDRKN